MALSLAVVLLAAGALLTAGAPANATSSNAKVWKGRAYTQVTVAPATLAALASLGVRPGAVAPARLSGTDPLAVRFPITRFTLPALVMKHTGGITLRAGTTKVKLSNFWIDLRRQRVSGQVAGVGRVDLFDIQFSPSSRPGPAPLELTSTAASALNGAFGVQAFTEGLLFGSASFKSASLRVA